MADITSPVDIRDNPAAPTVDPAKAVADESAALAQLNADVNKQAEEASATDHRSPMDPLYPAYTKINEGYADFLTSPAHSFLSSMKGYNFDPKTEALMSQGHDSGAGGIMAGILKGWMNTENEANAASGEGGTGKGAGVQTDWLAEGKAKADAVDAQNKAIAAKAKQDYDVRTKIANDFNAEQSVKDANMVLNPAAAFGELANKFKGAIKADGTIDRNIFSKDSEEAFKKLAAQAIRPGGRVAGSTGEEGGGLNIDPNNLPKGFVDYVFGSGTRMNPDDLNSLMEVVDATTLAAKKRYNEQYNQYIARLKNEGVPEQYTYAAIGKPYTLPEVAAGTIPGSQDNLAKAENLPLTNEQVLTQLAIDKGEAQAQKGIIANTSGDGVTKNKGDTVYNGNVYDKNGKLRGKLAGGN